MLGGDRRGMGGDKEHGFWLGNARILKLFLEGTTHELLVYPKSQITDFA